MAPKMSTEDSLSTLWETACTRYAQETGTALTSPDFPKLSTPSDLSSHLESEKEHFADFRMKKRPLFHAMQTILSPFENFGDLISSVVSMVFPPASTIMGAMVLLIRSARRVSDAFDSINALFQKLGYFAQRLDSYRVVPLSEGMKGVIVKVLATFLHVCGVSQSLLSRGSFRARFSKWAKNVLVEDTSVQGPLAELEELTGQEHKMVSAHSLNLTSQALKNTAILLEKSEMEDERERIDRLKVLLEPVPASGQVFSAINEGRIPGSGRWVEERIREWWDGNGPLLWIHGGPGVGKSYLASKIIGDLAKEGDAVVASFFCKNNDVDLRSFNKALRTLAWQVVVQRSTFAVHAEEFCLKGDPGNSYVVWRKLLLDYFETPTDDKVCFIIDGIDEADPDEQELFFSLLERTYSDGMERKPPVRVVLLGRDSVRSILDEHSLGWIHDIEITNNQNKDDLHGYVSQKLQKSKLFRNASDFQDEVVRDICTQAEGLWEWANLVIKNVLRCRTKEQIRKVVKTMPKGISAMLREELQRLARELSASDTMSDEEGSQIQQLNIILSFVTLAQRPLTVEHLDLILEILLGDEVLNLEDDLRTVYSSLFSLRLPENEEDEYNRSAVVTLRHSSFYEFFESSTIDAGLVHVNRNQAGATFLFVMLYALAKTDAPSSYRFLGPLKVYAMRCLPLHLRSADPEKVAAGRREDVSSLFADLLFDESLLKNWIINQIYTRFASSHNFHSSTEISDLGQYWWNCDDRDTANQVAEVALGWLIPDTRRTFEETAGDNACPFAVLFSSMARSCSRLWLGPEDIDNEDGLPAALSTLLFVYTEITATPTDTETSDKLIDITTDLRPGEILQAAESQGLQKTAMWHARVAQALLQHRHFQDALKHFQIALDEQDKAPTLSKKSVSVIHKDMARACTEIGRHKEALEQFGLFVSLDNNSEGPGYGLHGRIGNLLDAAHMEHRAKLSEKAISTARKAWEEFIGPEHRDHVSADLLLSFFVIFLELRQPHWFRSALDFAFDHFQDMQVVHIVGMEANKLVMFLIDALASEGRVMHSVLHYALTPEDTGHLDLIASIPGKLENSTPDYVNLAELKFWLASVLFEKGRLGDAIQSWCEIAASSDVPRHWWIEPVQRRSLSRLAAVCLYHPEALFCGDAPLALAEDDVSEVSLIVSSWLHDSGDIFHARKLLSEVVRRCIALLSDDDPANDIDAFVMLFKVFLIAMDSDDDLRAALYLIKAWNNGSDDPKLTHNTEEEVQHDLSSSLDKVGLADDEAEVQDQDPDDDWTRVDDTWQRTDPLTECSTCKHEISSINQWYFCRSCPFTALCRPCYRDFQSSLDTTQDHSHGITGKCNPQHKFFYSGQALRRAEYVPKGMVPLVGSSGQRQVVWIEEWKDKLLEKWTYTEIETVDSSGGGLSGWCMQVLPEAQRDRWGKFFKV